jgi:isopentenyl diphosphate isomerase/L-lactate dehydrogenase-like FMN-dependent dehydrogenase
MWPQNRRTSQKNVFTSVLENVEMAFTVLSGTDQQAREMATLGVEWLKEFQGQFMTWEDLKFLREHWDGPLVLKGIQRPEAGFLSTPLTLRLT